MIEILRIIITILGFASTSNGTDTVNMVNFGGYTSGPYFTGEVMPGGVDTQSFNRQGTGSLSARYMLKGTDCAGDSCMIFIENNGVFGEPFTHPRIVTDSKALSYLNEDCLRGKIISNPSSHLEISIGIPLDSVSLAVHQPKHRGRLEEFRYKSGKLNKRAMVYLPFDYNASDKAKKYDVLYLIHGGGDNTTSFFSDSRSPLPLTDVVDYLIAEGKMEPVIVVCPTFYDDDTNIGNNAMNDAIAATRNFHNELRSSLIPAVETHYNTHYERGKRDAVDKSREHRSFGGFSMGALCTWYQLALDPNAVKNYLPLSGDLWIYDGNNEKKSAEDAAKWLKSQIEKANVNCDFRIFAYTGDKDIAYVPENALIKALYSLPDTPFTPSNIEYGVKEGGVHYYGDINEYLYHALPRVFPPKAN